MKQYYIFILLILINIGLVPVSSLQANAVPVEITSQKEVQKIKKKRQRSFKKHHKKRFKNKRKKQAPKPEQQNDYEGIWAMIITFLSIYIITAIVLIVVGFVFAFPVLWITGICLLVTPFIIHLLIWLGEDIQVRKSIKKEAERKRKENQ
jgi:Flp pilus assembly protein TadB